MAGPKTWVLEFGRELVVLCASIVVLGETSLCLLYIRKGNIELERKELIFVAKLLYNK